MSEQRIETVEAERDDLANRLSALLCDLTGGLMSKTGYSVSTMVQAVEAEFEKHATAEMVNLIEQRDRAERRHEWLESAVESLANDWDASDEHGNPLREGSLGEAADELRSLLPPTTDGAADGRDRGAR